MNKAERSITTRPMPVQWPPTWPQTDPEQSGLMPLLATTPELLKRVYCRPDYQEIIRKNTMEMLKQLEQHPEALKALQESLERYGIKFDEAERIEPITTVAAVSFAIGTGIGLIIGWFSE